MERTLLRDIFRNSERFADKEITVAGWVKTLRASNAFGFIELSDGSCFSRLQVVFENERLGNYKEIAKQNVGAALVVKGALKLTPGAQQPFELKAAHIDVEGGSTPEYPLQKKKHSLEYLRTIAHLRPRANTFYAAFRVRSAAAQAIHKFFAERGFVYVHTPIITANDCEGAGEMFRVTTIDPDNPPRGKDGGVDYARDFFGKESSLTVSGQLEAECFAMAYGSVYTFGPTFRAENSNTPRHAAEFWMIEPEIAFADLNDDMRLSADMVKYVISEVLRECPQEMEFFNRYFDDTIIRRLTALTDAEFGCVTYTEAVELLQKSGRKFEFPVKWGIDLQTEHERYLTETVFEKPVFLIDYPKDIKAFYMRMNDDGKTVAAMDMLVPGVGELIGGSQREERHDLLVERMRQMSLAPQDYWWYLELRKYGGTKHAGFGMGFERLIMYLTGISNIRDVTAFPRTVGSADF